MPGCRLRVSLAWLPYCGCAAVWWVRGKPPDLNVPVGRIGRLRKPACADARVAGSYLPLLHSMNRPPPDVASSCPASGACRRGAGDPVCVCCMPIGWPGRTAHSPQSGRSGCPPRHGHAGGLAGIPDICGEYYGWGALGPAPLCRKRLPLWQRAWPRTAKFGCRGPCGPRCRLA